MAEFLGARISLISKSDIKYIGTLKAIDSDSATVSLAEVQCLGTEGRKGDPSQELPGSDVIYEGIVFRGSDVKDLQILASPQELRSQEMPNDPAILGSSQPAPPTQPPSQQPPAQAQHPPPPPPPSQNHFRSPPPPFPNQPPLFGYQGPPPHPNHFNQPRFQNPGGPHGFPGSPGAVPGFGMGFNGPPPGYGMPGMGYGPPPTGPGFPPGPPPGPFPPQQMPIGPPGQHMNQQRPPQQMPGSQHPPIGSKQGTPAPISATISEAPPAQSQQKPVEMSTTPAPLAAAMTAVPPPPPIESKPSAAEATAPPATTQQASAPKPAPKTNSRIAVPLPPTGPGAVKPQTKPIAQATAPAPAAVQTQSIAHATEAATAAVAAAMAKLGVSNQQRGENDATQRTGVNRVQQDGQTRGRGRGRGGAPRGGRGGYAQKTLDVPREDYDFESANAKFNKQELVKEAIASGSPISSPVNGATADPLVSATNGHAAHDDEDVVIPAKPTTEKGYDKKSSFFDNISSDLKERYEQQAAEQTIDGRAMRREERSKNMETFGQGSVDNAYRGRGRGRGRGFGRGGRGYYNNGGGRGGYEDRGRGRGGAAAAPV